MSGYPCLEFDLPKLRHNLSALSQRCQAVGIRLAGAVKGVQSNPKLVREYLPYCDQIAISRLSQAKMLRQAGITADLLMLRLPMMSEIPELVALTQYSLNSQFCVIRQIEEECKHQNKQHKVILMADEGDLREGYWDKTQLIEDALRIEQQMQHVCLAGVGVNLGCYGSILPSTQNLGDLVQIAREIEQRIGRKLEIVSGGATTSLHLMLTGAMPEGINHLRIGEAIMNARDLHDRRGMNTDFLDPHVVTLKAEVLEVFAKPSHPIGEIDLDAFGHKRSYLDRGIRRRALLALGRQDVGYLEDLRPQMSGVQILGGSSDHLILDIEDSKEEWYPGKIVCFDLNYGTLMFATNSPDISIRYFE